RRRRRQAPDRPRHRDADVRARRPRPRRRRRRARRLAGPALLPPAPRGAGQQGAARGTRRRSGGGGGVGEGQSAPWVRRFAAARASRKCPPALRRPYRPTDAFALALTFGIGLPGFCTGLAARPSPTAFSTLTTVASSGLPASLSPR